MVPKAPEADPLPVHARTQRYPLPGLQAASWTVHTGYPFLSARRTTDKMQNLSEAFCPTVSAYMTLAYVS